MKTVKLIHPKKLSAANGANTVINSLLDSKEQFRLGGFEISSLSPDSFLQKAIIGDKNPKPSLGKGYRAMIKKKLRWLTNYSRLAADLIIYLNNLRPAKQIVKTYLSSNPAPDEIVFFHTLLPCYYYLKNRKTYQHTVLVCHTNGDNHKMHKIYYPKLEKSCVYKKLLRMEQYVIGHVDRINFVASSARDLFLELHPDADAKKVSYIYNGVTDIIKSQRTKPKCEKIEYVCVASISRRKGQNYIIEALKRFDKDKLPNLHFTFVGDGPDRQALQNDVVSAGLGQYVTFAGMSNNVDAYLVNSDVFILPSEDEGLPMAIIEAMRASLPIVSTPVGGIPEMVDNGVNGLLIQPTADDVYKVLSNSNSYDWRSMGINARKKFEENFTVEKMVEGYIDLLTF